MRHLNANMWAMISVWIVLFIATVWYKFSVQSKCKVKVTATVTEIEEYEFRGRRGGKGYMYVPTFSYPWRGFERTLQSRIKSSFTHFEVGDQVELLIDPDNPDNFRYRSWKYDPITQICILQFMALIPFFMSMAGK